MSKKKNNKQQSSKTFNPEDYIRQKARLLPIYKCYKTVDTYEDRAVTIFVIRKHPQGTFTYAAYLLDKWCLGVKDSLWQFSIDESEMNAVLERFGEEMPMEEIEYVEAHNWVYGALEFALDAGIKPCKDFALTQYVLKEDNDDVELIEYDFGRDGEYCLVAKNTFEASRYIPILDKTLGKGKYTVEIGPDVDEDENDDDDEDDDDWNLFPFASTPDMEYTYKGKDYPKEITLHHPEVESIVMKDMSEITEEEIGHVLSLNADEVREDLQNLVMRELGVQWGKTVQELEDDIPTEWIMIGNAFMLLTKVGTVKDTLPVVLEVMRQSCDFYDFNFGDISDTLNYPLLYVLIKDNPRLVKPYLLEPGLYNYFKTNVLELLDYMVENLPERRQEIVDMTVELLNEYKKDLPERTICDGGIVAFTIGILVSAGAAEHLPLIEEIYATGLVDESVEGHIEELRKSILNPEKLYDLPLTDPYDIRKSYIKLMENTK